MKMGSVDTLVFFVNGKKIEDNDIDPEWTLLYYLRNKLRLCGTKLGCGEGGCGACTVMVSKYDRRKDEVLHIPVNACLAPVCAMHGLAVTTVEGIGSTKTRLHPVQERIAKAHGSQCGFCTPGIVMSMYTLLRSSEKISMSDIEESFQGNLCRCTGYRPIIEAYRTFTEEWEILQNANKLTNGNVNGNGCAMGDKCCKLQNGSNKQNNLYNTSEFIPYHPSQEPIFPPELKLYNKYDNQYLTIKGKSVAWYRPANLRDLLKLKHTYPDGKLIVGNTELGIEAKFKRFSHPILIQPTAVQELQEIKTTNTGVKIGASVTLTDIKNYLQKQIKDLPESKTRIFSAVVEMLNVFAGKQIRSVGSLGGNIITGSPISDLVPILMAIKAELEIESLTGKTVLKLDKNFYSGYRKTILKPDEVLLSIHIPYTNPNQYFVAYKQSKRRDDDIAIVNTAVNMVFEPGSNIIVDIGLAFGGMSFNTVVAPLTEEKLKGLRLNSDTIEIAFTHLLKDLPLDASAPGGMIEYRKSLVLGLFFKSYLQISQKIQEHLPNFKLNPREISGGSCFKPPIPKSSQYFSAKSKKANEFDTILTPIVHLSAFKQATGEAIYTDDIPKFEGELYLAFVYSTKAHAKIIKIDPTEALAIQGVFDFVSAKDTDEKYNKLGAVVQDEKVFYDDVVTSTGQIIAAIVADKLITAQRAARKVKIEYEELQPVIITIEDAIKHKSFFSGEQNFSLGDVEKALKESPHVIEGEVKMEGQDHFYLETQACICVPKKEDDEMDVYSSTQSPSELTKMLSEILGVQQNKVIGKVKRLGGGFGGKQSKATIFAAPVAVAAAKLSRPIRMILDRDEDLIMKGGRNPFLMKYKIGFDNNGKLLACDVLLYCNGGYSEDLSPAVLEKACTHFQNGYFIPAVRVKGYTCKTNLPSNTAYRGFGGPQGMLVAETMVREVAEFLNKDVLEVTTLNLYKNGDVTPYNQTIVDSTLLRCWKEIIHSSDYYSRRKNADEFNRQNRYKKRGLSVIPTFYGIAFTELFLNQGCALVLVYTDGSVLLNHGGIEMGQGLNTKLIQIASRVLEIPINKIHTNETGTDKVANVTPTAGSSGSDLYGMAVLDACNTIKERLKPYKETNPTGTWEDWVNKAYFDRVSLSATGFYKTPGIGYDPKSKTGDLYNYYTSGAAVTEVEIDTLTGAHQVIRTDIIMDLGESLNPAIDVGQIEGGFIQGYGLYVLEQMLYSPDGTTITTGIDKYKVPAFTDIPGEFNVTLLKDSSNPRAIYSSKAIGEPPLFLASSVFFAIRDAIKAARDEFNVKGVLKLTSPATAERIRMACQDNITSKIPELPTKGFKPWNIVPI